MAAQVQKVSISLPKSLVELVDEIANEKGMKRSTVVSLCLQDFAAKRFQAEMEEGYKVMAGEHAAFSEITSSIGHEVVPEWGK